MQHGSQQQETATSGYLIERTIIVPRQHVKIRCGRQCFAKFCLKGHGNWVNNDHIISVPDEKVNKENNMTSFNSLDLPNKSDILRQQANYLLSIEFEHYTVKLFTWDRFFIEEYFDNDQEQVTRIKLAGSHDILKYLKQISLKDLGSPTAV
jgi:hypothetical protein